jgi:hypothetical protein
VNLYSIIDLGTPTWPPGFYVQPMAINNPRLRGRDRLAAPGAGGSTRPLLRDPGGLGWRVLARTRARVMKKRSAARGEGCHPPASYLSADSFASGKQGGMRTLSDSPLSHPALIPHGLGQEPPTALPIAADLGGPAPSLVAIVAKQ